MLLLAGDTEGAENNFSCSVAPMPVVQGHGGVQVGLWPCGCAPLRVVQHPEGVRVGSQLCGCALLRKEGGGVGLGCGASMGSAGDTEVAEHDVSCSAAPMLVVWRPEGVRGVSGPCSCPLLRKDGGGGQLEWGGDGGAQAGCSALANTATSARYTLALPNGCPQPCPNACTAFTAEGRVVVVVVGWMAVMQDEAPNVLATWHVPGPIGLTVLPARSARAWLRA